MRRGDLNWKQAREIIKGYKIVDSQRKSPKVEYDPETQGISRVTIKEGYGEDEIEYWLLPSGYCWKVNMKKYREAFRERLLNPRSLKSGSSEYQTLLFSREVLSILKSRRGTLEPEEYEKLLNFFEGIKDRIDEVCRAYYSQRQSFRR